MKRVSPGIDSQQESLTCRTVLVHEEDVARVRAATPEAAVLHRLAGLFKVIGDPTRMRILYALSITELCVCDIAALTGMTQSATSHQLRILREARLVRYRREGKVVYYALDDAHVEQLLATGTAHVQHG